MTLITSAIFFLHSNTWVSVRLATWENTCAHQGLRILRDSLNSAHIALTFTFCLLCPNTEHMKKTAIAE